MSKKKRSRPRRKASKRSMRMNSSKKRKKAKKKSSKKAAKKAIRKSSKKSRKASKKAKKSRKSRKSRKASKKASPRRRRRASPMQKARRARSALKRISKSAMKSARAMGMLKSARRNPGGILGFMKAEAADMMAMAPSIAIQLGAMAAVGFAASKASEQIRKRAKSGGAVDKYAGAISSGAITIAAFAAMKMMKNDKIRKFSMPVLMGGMAATMVQILAAVKVKKDAAEISLGQKLGLPIGEYMALNGFLDVHGRQIAIDGFGEYVDQPLGAIDISRDRFGEGSVVSMGEYVDQPLGAFPIRQTIEGSALGEIGQMSEQRQGSRALGAEGDMTIESFVDKGSLSGSVFD